MSIAALASDGRADTGAATGTVVGKVEVRKSGGKRSDRSGVVVYLEGVPGGKPEERRAEIRQRNKQFTPSVLVVVKGTPVDFPNDDRIAHNVYSDTRGNSFDLGVYKYGDSESWIFKRTGEVDIRCNKHPSMKAQVLVVDSGFYAITRADGTFEIPNVPPGTYPIVAWLPNSVEARGKVKVREGMQTRIRLRVEEGEAPSNRKRKTGTPFGRYPD